MFDALRNRRVVALPDLFLDLLVPMPAWENARNELDAIAARGGGNLPVGAPELRLGGNAMNLAGAMQQLGAPTSLIAETDDMGRALLAKRHPRLDATCVRIGQGATTVALECPGANVMLSHSGPVVDASLDTSDPEVMHRLRNADAVAVVNWSATRQGSQLLVDVRRAAPDAWLYFDTGDLSRRRDEIPQLLDAVRQARVDVWAMNEQEARFVGAHGMPVGQKLAQRLGTRLDVHTRDEATSYGDDITTVPAHATNGSKATGAGDHWNAGNLAGDLLDLADADRLQLAHDVATAYVTGAPLGPLATA